MSKYFIPTYFSIEYTTKMQGDHYFLGTGGTENGEAIKMPPKEGATKKSKVPKRGARFFSRFRKIYSIPITSFQTIS